MISLLLNGAKLPSVMLMHYAVVAVLYRIVVAVVAVGSWQ